MINKEKLINHFLSVNYQLTGQDLSISNIDDVVVNVSFIQGDEIDISIQDSNEYIGSIIMSGEELKEFLYLGGDVNLLADDWDLDEELDLDEEAVERKLLVNMIETPDGTLLQSKSQNDFVSHKDLNGESFFVDGGISYRRIMGSGWIDRALYEGDSHDELREHFRWGSRGVNGDAPLSWIALKDMTKDHINAIINEGHGSDHVIDLMEDELKWRSFAGKYL